MHYYKYIKITILDTIHPAIIIIVPIVLLHIYHNVININHWSITIYNTCNIHFFELFTRPTDTPEILVQYVDNYFCVCCNCQLDFFVESPDFGTSTLSNP